MDNHISHWGNTAVVIAALSSGKLEDGNPMQPTGQHVERPGPILGN